MLTNLVTFALLGLGSGALIGGLAMGIVVSFRGSGLVNLATGAIATLGAYTFYGLRSGGYLYLPLIPFAPARVTLGAPMGTGPAFVIALAVCAATGALFDLLVLRRLRGASPLAKLVASLGLMLTIQAFVVLRFGSDGAAAPAVLPDSASLSVFGTPVPTDQFILVGILALVTIALSVLYRYTRFGLATLAAAENESSAMLRGLSPNVLSLANGVLAAVIACALGILAAPLTSLDPNTIVLAVIPALAAALFASFTSLPTAAVAGLLMGVVGSWITYLQSLSWFPTTSGLPLPGVTDVIYFLAIVVAMILRGRRVPSRGTIREARLPESPVPQHMARATTAIAVAGVIGLLVLPYDFRQALVSTIIGAVLCLSLVVITGFVGQVSLLNLALGGIAAFITSKLALHAGIGFPIGPMIGVAASAAVGFASGIPALRVRGVNLAIVTLAAAVALENFGFNNGTWGAGATASPVPAPTLVGLDLGTRAGFPIGSGGIPTPVFGLVALAAAILVALLVASLRRSSLGQKMLAVRSNEKAAAAAGLNVAGVKLVAFTVSSAIAGIGGVLYAYNFGSVSTDQFTLMVGLSFVAYAFLGGIASVGGAIFGGLLTAGGLCSYALQKWAGIPSDWELIIGGLALVVTVALNPEGLVAGSKLAYRRIAARRRGTRVAAIQGAPVPEIGASTREP